MHLKLMPIVVALISISLVSCGLIPTQADSTIDAVNVDHDRLAIKGYDPVAYFTLSQPTLGVPQYTAEYQGAIYQFVSTEHQQLFMQDPQQYAPQYGGYCAFGVSKEKKYDTDPMAWAIVDNKLYLNLNRKVQVRWDLDRQALISEADQIWTQIENTPVSQL